MVALQDALARHRFALFLPLIGFNRQNIQRAVLETRWPLLAFAVSIRRGGLARCLSGPGGRARQAPRAGAHGAATRAAGCRVIGLSRSASLLYPVSSWCSARGAVKVDRQFRHPDPDLRHAGLGPQHRGRPRRACSILGYCRLLCVAPIPMRCSPRPSAVLLDLLPLAGCLAAFWGILLGFPVLRLRGDYLAIVTLAFGEIIRLVPDQLGPGDNGYAGISSIRAELSSAFRSTLR
jgi:hypothetical protein